MASQHLLPRSYVINVIDRQLPDLTPHERAETLYVLDRLCPDIDGELRYEDTCYLLGRAGCSRVAHRLSQFVGPTDAEITLRPTRGYEGRIERFNNLFWPGNVTVESDLHITGGSVLGRLHVKGNLINEGFLLTGTAKIEGRIFGQPPIPAGEPVNQINIPETPRSTPIQAILDPIPPEEIPQQFQCLRNVQPSAASLENELSPAFN